MSRYSLDQSSKIREGYDSKVALPLALVTIFCFGFVMMHPFTKTSDLSSVSKQPQTGFNSPNLNVKVIAPQASAAPLPSDPTLANPAPPITNPASSINTVSPVVTATPQPAVGNVDGSATTAPSGSSNSASGLFSDINKPATKTNSITAIVDNVQQNLTF